jgi:hypothetical protein
MDTAAMQQTTTELQKKSSAITLSDMEVFIFPEIMYSLVLANLMSPRIWQWRADPWFEGLDAMKSYRRITRLKQYIMDHYAFNLDLDTWGLTDSQTELARFRDIIDEQTLAQSNALFGYEGDKYYFDIDIRTHFGLDKYDGNVIPYWKTETVEAMDAFIHRDGYTTGAGECVSLATLYAAALFVVAGIPLRDIFLMATPLHSQNFVDINDGILTNNRRLVTKTMWFNGTALSAQARRALENERVTIVTHATGHIHTLYDTASIAPEDYARFRAQLSGFLTVPLSKEILGNFFRNNRDIQRCFQLRWPRNGCDRYIALERAFKYEDDGPYRISDHTRAKLMTEVDAEEFECRRLPGRIVLNDLEAFLDEHKPDIGRPEDVARLKTQFASDCLNAELALQSLLSFCRTNPRLPKESEKRFVSTACPLQIEPNITREALIAHLEAIRATNPVADLAFYAYRDLTRIEPEPYLMACTQRNPVCIRATADLSLDALTAHLNTLPNESIYDGVGRLAQPDEVWNFQRGDGLEKAILLANIMRARTGKAVTVTITPDAASIAGQGHAAQFATRKGIAPQTWPIAP